MVYEELGALRTVREYDATKTSLSTAVTEPVATWPSNDFVAQLKADHLVNDVAIASWNAGQSLPVYSDIHEVAYSDKSVYVRGSGLPSYEIGPWYSETTGNIIGNWPENEAFIYQFPRYPAENTDPAGKTKNDIGAVGKWVNGVSILNPLDGIYYDTTTGTEVEIPLGGTNTVFWTRTAAVEVPEADKALGHAPLKPMGSTSGFTAEYHSHMNPSYLRAQLGDNVLWISKEGHYEELASHHSPILGWANDGFPVYGPYGYSDPATPGSFRRMRSGFALRDGTNGSTDLTTTGRHTLPKWMVDFHGGVSPALASTDYGPDISTDFPLGRYVEDYTYLGDLGKTKGTDFDLDQYNGRVCVTPEYPNGTYAYFLTIDDTGAPVFPYVVCREYFGVATGMKVLSYAAGETVTVYAYGALSWPITSIVTLVGAGCWWWWKGVKPTKSITWNSVEGFYYEIEGFRGGGWVTYEFTKTRATGTQTTYTFGTESPLFDCTSYRVKAVGYDPYDSVY